MENTPKQGSCIRGRVAVRPKTTVSQLILRGLEAQMLPLTLKTVGTRQSNTNMASEEEVYNKLCLISQQRNLIQQWVCVNGDRS